MGVEMWFLSPDGFDPGLWRSLLFNLWKGHLVVPTRSQRIAWLTLTIFHCISLRKGERFVYCLLFQIDFLPKISSTLCERVAWCVFVFPYCCFCLGCLYTLPPIIMEVKNGCISNSSYLSNIAIFHWTMIMGERVHFETCCFFTNYPWHL